MEGVLDYHAHLYYDESTINEAKELARQASERFSVPVGRFHEKPVGPHPVWSCQLTVSKESFGDVIGWLLMNHGAVDVFVHPNTSDDLKDHTKTVMWIGKSYTLNLGIFQK